MKLCLHSLIGQCLESIYTLSNSGTNIYPPVSVVVQPVVITGWNTNRNNSLANNPEKSFINFSTFISILNNFIRQDKLTNEQFFKHGARPKSFNYLLVYYQNMEYKYLQEQLLRTPKWLPNDMLSSAVMVLI